MYRASYSEKGRGIMAKYNVHAGHCPQDQGAYGAVGLLKESVENRIVKDEVIRLLKAQGHTVYDCTCSENTTQDGCLSKIVKKCNAHKVDLDISIHLNSGHNDYQGDGSIGGVEVWNYSEETAEVSGRICSKITKALGIQNRGTKYDQSLYVLKYTKSPALLIECCFVDDKDDADKWEPKVCAKAIVEGILNKALSNTIASNPIKTNKVPYLAKITANTLNVRNGAGTKYKINKQVKYGDVYTIVEEKNGWGKLKSGVDWIRLDHISKI